MEKEINGLSIHPPFKQNKTHKKMKNKNLKKRRAFLAGLTFFFMLLFSIMVSSAASCNPEISLLNQNPHPATPGSYVDLVFQVSGVANSDCKGMVFQLVGDYPFSFDEDSTRILEGSTWTAGFSNVWNIPYKVRVDSAAFDGESKIEVRYSVNPSNKDFFISREFSIRVQDLRTDFDAVIQDVSGNDVIIAIANTGKYAANSVVVRIPEQKNFKSTTTDGQMVGNLDAGDYTIVSFTISTNEQGNGTPQSSPKFEFDIHYTDSLGERRIVNIELPLRLEVRDTTTLTNSPSRNSPNQSTSSIWSNKYPWIGLALIIFMLLYNKYGYKMRKHFSDSKSKNYSIELPSWIKNSKLKEGKK